MAFEYFEPQRDQQCCRDRGPSQSQVTASETSMFKFGESTTAALSEPLLVGCIVRYLCLRLP